MVASPPAAAHPPAGAVAPPPRWGRGERLGLGLLATLLFLLLARGAQEVGLPHDEVVYVIAAEHESRWLLGPDDDADRTDPPSSPDQAFGLVPEHPPVGRYPIGLGLRLAPSSVGRPRAHRLGSAALFAALAVSLYLVARRRWGRTAGAAAALCLVVSPRLVGHGQVAALDLPAAATCFWSAVAFYRARSGFGRALLFGAVFGLALATKLNAWLVPFALVGWAMLYRRREHAEAVGAMLFVSPAVMVGAWPWLWHDTLGRLADYVSFHARHALYPAWYFGQLYRDPPAPWHYPLVMAAVTLPLAVLLLVLVGTWRFAAGRGRDPLAGLALIAGGLQILAVAGPGRPRYDGERTFLAAFPFLFLLAGSGFAWLAARARAHLARRGPGPIRRLAGAAAPVAAVALFLPLAVQVARQHPYELNFYGALVGGMRGALALGFESTSWGAHPVNPEVARWLDANLPPGATIEWNSGAYGALRYYREVGLLRPDLRFARGARYWVLECQQAYGSGPWWWQLYEDRYPGWRRIHQFARDGVPLVNVFERIAVPPPAEPGEEGGG